MLASSAAAFAAFGSASPKPMRSSGLDPEVLAALTAAKDALVDLGARLVPVTFPSIADGVNRLGASVLWSKRRSRMRRHIPAVRTSMVRGWVTSSRRAAR